MGTLYDVLGISQQTNAEQISRAYRACLDSMTAETSNPSNAENDLIRAKAIKEAYAILSSPARRDAYDARLAEKANPIVMIIEKPPLPWAAILFSSVFVIAIIAFVKIRNKEVDTVKAVIDAQTSLAEKVRIEEGEKNAEASLARERSQETRRAEEKMRYETERARSDGRRVHEDLQQAERQQRAENERAATRREHEHQAELSAERQRVQQQRYNMERAIRYRQVSD